MKTILTALVAIGLAPSAWALELFGQSLLNGDGEAFEQAVVERGYKRAGGGVTDIYTTFDVTDLFPGAQSLYLGVDDEDGKIAFVEYCISPKARFAISEVLSDRYGGSLEIPGRYYRDSVSVWSKDTVQIQLTQFPASDCLSLTYSVPERMAKLRERYSNDAAIETYPDFAL